MARTLAVDKEGNISWCSVPPELRGTNGCPHVGHQNEGETAANFSRRSEMVSYAPKVTEAMVEDQREKQGRFGRGIKIIEPRILRRDI